MKNLNERISKFENYLEENFSNEQRKIIENYADTFNLLFSTKVTDKRTAMIVRSIITAVSQTMNKIDFEYCTGTIESVYETLDKLGFKEEKENVEFARFLLIAKENWPGAVYFNFEEKIKSNYEVYKGVKTLKELISIYFKNEFDYLEESHLNSFNLLLENYMIFGYIPPRKIAWALENIPERLLIISQLITIFNSMETKLTKDYKQNWELNCNLRFDDAFELQYFWFSAFKEVIRSKKVEQLEKILPVVEGEVTALIYALATTFPLLYPYKRNTINWD